MSERREAEGASRLEVLRFAVSVGIDDIEAGRFKIFDSSASLRFVSLRQTCMKSFDVLANLVVEFNPMRSTADGQTSKGRANGW